MVEPLTLATTYATVISLIGNFRTERQNNESVDYQDFLLWLVEHQHQDVKQAIEANHRTAISVKSILNQKADLILEKIKGIDAIIAGISMRVHELAPLAESLYSEKLLSDDALSIIAELDRSGSSYFFVVRSIGAQPYINFQQGGGLKTSDPRFLEDDLETLINLGFLTPRHGGRELVYHITRAAVDYLNVIGNRGADVPRNS